MRIVLRSGAMFTAIWLSFSLQAQLAFSLVNDEVGFNHHYGNTNLMGGGSAFFDYNGDGHLDLWVTGGSNRDALYKNNGDGTFTEVGDDAGLALTWDYTTFGVITGDVDNDGDRDVFITTSDGDPNRLFRNEGDGTFTDASAAAGILGEIAWSTSASFGDYNLDGYLDLYVGNYVFDFGFLYDSTGVAYGFDHDCDANWFYLNDGSGAFMEVSDVIGGGADSACVLATAWTDFDNDHDMDMFIANDFGEWIVPNQLLENPYPVQTFEDIAPAVSADQGMYGMGIAIGDPDHDLDLDYYVTNIGQNWLGENQGDGTFTEITAAAGVEDTYIDSGLFTVGWGTAFVDLDNDTWQDLLVSNGYIPAFSFIGNDVENNNRCFQNNGDGTYTDIAPMLGMNDSGIARGFSCGDYDGDGDVDLLYNNIESFLTAQPDEVLLYRNDQSSGNNWLKVDVVGTVNNRDGYGTHLQISVGGDSWIEEVSGGSSHASQNSSTVHFGLGSATEVDELLVTWPGGWEQTFENLAVNQTLTITEDTSTVIEPSGLPGIEHGLGLQILPNPALHDTRIRVELPAATNLQVIVMDPSGRSIRLLHEGTKPAGLHEFYWDLRDASGMSVPTGHYLVELRSDKERFHGKILVIR